MYTNTVNYLIGFFVFFVIAIITGLFKIIVQLPLCRPRRDCWQSIVKLVNYLLMTIVCILQLTTHKNLLEYLTTFIKWNKTNTILSEQFQIKNIKTVERGKIDTPNTQIHDLGVLDTTLCDKVCQRLATGRWFSPGTPVFSTNKTYRHFITEILLKVALNIINQPTKPNTWPLIFLAWDRHFNNKWRG